MTTDTMTLAAYARTHSASRQAAAKWQQAGYLVMRGTAVDVAASDAKMAGAGKGRFRLKAHGGRRTAGVRGAMDRPGLGFVAGQRVAQPVAAPADHDPMPEPWSGWAWAGNPTNPLSKAARVFIAADDPDAEEQIAALIDYSEWENACTHLGWDRWPAAVAVTIAGELGIGNQAARVQEVLHRHVRSRLVDVLKLEPTDLRDPRLEAR